jgi:hypothetical protein
VSARVYFVAMFGLFTAMAAALTVNWWVVTEAWGEPWRYALPAFGVAMTLLAGLWTVEAALARYRP